MLEGFEITPPLQTRRAHDAVSSCKAPPPSCNVTKICRSLFAHMGLDALDRSNTASRQNYATSFWSASPEKRDSASSIGWQRSKAAQPLRRNSPELSQAEAENFEGVSPGAVTALLDTEEADPVKSCLPVRQSWQNAGECVLCGDPVDSFDCDLTSTASEHCADCTWLVNIYVARKRT